MFVTKKWQKITQLLCNFLAGLLLFKIYHVLHPRFYPEIVRHILKSKQRNMCLYSWDYTINQIENQDENEKIDHIDST